VTAPVLRRDLSPLTSASLEAGNVVLRELDVSGPATVVRMVTIRPEERYALALFLVEVEAATAADDEEPMCGEVRPEDEAVCAELEGHAEHDVPHLWIGGAKNLCMAEPVRLALPKPERKEQR
jgi:hypothetical protein